MLPLKIEHAPEIAELEAQLFPDNCMNFRTLEAEIQHGFGYVIHDNNELAGYLLARRQDGLVDITRLGISKKYQGQGLAKLLLSKITEEHSDVMLTVAKNNYTALGLYFGFSFQIVGETEKSWVMRRTTSG